jgi:UDP-GlcNAc:undecaprenyl-phosphate GlcNAc-1-phosphate transferase
MLDHAISLVLTIKLELLLLTLVMFIAVIFWNNLFKFFNLRAYKFKQRLHQDEVPRVGGLIIFLFLSLIALVKFESDLLNLLLISFVPLAFISVKEDFFHNTRPQLRLLVMIASCFIFLIFIPSQFPIIDIPYFKELINLKFIGLTFFVFSMLVIINGNNLIDGVNGNMGITNLVQLLVLSFLGLKLGDYDFSNLCILFSIPLVVFLFFNFPFGKIFMGDLGAYFYGFTLSGLVIYFFGKYDNILSWNAVLILFYPAMELLFSFVRKKFFQKKNPLLPDVKHLHSLIFLLIKNSKKTLNNSYSIIFLFPFIFSSSFVLLFYYSLFKLITVIFLISIIYISFYILCTFFLKSRCYDFKI